MGNRFDVSLKEIEEMVSSPQKAIQLAVGGLLNDDRQHKQWYLERILEALGEDLNAIRQELLPDYDWDEGVAP